MRLAFTEMTADELKTLAGNLQAEVQKMGTPYHRRDEKQKQGWPVRCLDVHEKDDCYVLNVEVGSSTLSQAWVGGGHTAQFAVTVRKDPEHPSRARIEVADHGDGFLELEHSVTSNRRLPNYMKEGYTTSQTSAPASFTADLHRFLQFQEKTGRIVSDHKLGTMGVDEVYSLQEDNHPVANYVRTSAPALRL